MAVNKDRCDTMPTFDCSSMVRTHVQRATQSPFYSQFREEVTRQPCAVYEARAKMVSSTEPIPRIVNYRPTGSVFFPFANDRSIEVGDSQMHECVALIGGNDFFTKFVAEQYLSRGISVTVLAKDVEKAKAVFVPIASGEREERVKASQGYVRLPSCSEAEPMGEGVYTDEKRKWRAWWYNYSSAVVVSSSKSSNTFLPSSPSVAHHIKRNVRLEIVEGDTSTTEAIEFAVRRASVVYFFGSSLLCHKETPSEKGKWYKVQSLFGFLPSFRCLSSADSSSSELDRGTPRDHSGFLHVVDACRRVDAHLVSLTPLWVHGSWLSPVFWYRCLMTYPSGYVRAVRRQELCLLESSGVPSLRCYGGPGGDSDLIEKPPVWRQWWSILRSTKLPDDVEDTPRSSVRFSLFRLSDVVYPSFNTRVVAVKNNRVDSAMHVQNIDTGDLDARLLANVLVKTLALCESVIESRVDIGGRLRDGVDMRDTAAVLELFSRFRNEE